MKENEEYSFDKAKEYAKKIIDGMAKEGLSYRDASRVLRIATNALGLQMKSEKVKTPQ